MFKNQMLLMAVMACLATYCPGDELDESTESTFAAVTGEDVTEGAQAAEITENTVEPVKDKAEVSTKKIRNSTLQSHLLDNVDIFGKNDMPAIYILGPGESDIESHILTRDFYRDPYFMQNIDREEFEMGLTMRIFQEKDEDKKYDR